MGMKTEAEETNPQIASCSSEGEPQLQAAAAMKLPRVCSLTHLLEMDCFGSISQLLGDNNINNATFDNQNTTLMTATNNNGIVPFGLEVPHQYSQNGIFNQPIFVNPAFQFQ